MLINHHAADETESQRIFVNTDQVLVALADSDGLLIGVNLYLPRCQYIRSTTISQKRSFGRIKIVLHRIAIADKVCNFTRSQ